MPNVKVFGIKLNPGPFTVKEHVLLTVMATVGYSSAYAVSLVSPAPVPFARAHILTARLV